MHCAPSSRHRCRCGRLIPVVSEAPGRMLIGSALWSPGCCRSVLTIDLQLLHTRHTRQYVIAITSLQTLNTSKLRVSMVLRTLPTSCNKVSSFLLMASSAHLSLQEHRLCMNNNILLLCYEITTWDMVTAMGVQSYWDHTVDPCPTESSLIRWCLYL